MSDEVVIRPLLPADVPGAETINRRAIDTGAPRDTAEETGGVPSVRGRARIAHLQGTDPDGAWVAERHGRIVGIALALVREGVWGLSLFGVDGEHHGRGIGRRLLAPALAYGAGTRAGIICAGEHPAAMRMYARAGFLVLPCVSAAGIVERHALPGGLRARPGTLDDPRDLGLCAAASRAVRGAAHTVDLPALLAAGDELLVADDGGFAVHHEGSCVLLAAGDEATARDLLWSALAAGPPGATVDVGFVTAGNDWAVDVALRAGLALSVSGPVFVRGDPGPLAPYLPSGTFL